MIDLTPYRRALATHRSYQPFGQVVQIIGLSVEATGLDLRLGDTCHILGSAGQAALPAEVVGIKDDRLILMPFGEAAGVQKGSPIVATSGFRIPAGPGVLGRVLDGLGRPIDNLGPLSSVQFTGLSSAPPDPLGRDRIDQPFVTGIRAIDGLTTCGHGQRLGIFAGSGVGKSTLLGMIARQSQADVSVIALIGERGREVQEFIERDLGPAGLARSVVVVATSDQPAIVRLKAAWVATTIAEWFREQGAAVTLLMDSVTRFAMAQREIGLAAGEPPALRGYPPSVFSLLPRLLERAGTDRSGSITGFYTVLVEGDDFTEPVTDTVRSILDGHIYLTRTLAAEHHYPAIDVLGSVSRLMAEVTDADHQRWAGRLRDTLATYHQARDLIQIGAYVAGSDPRVDDAVQRLPLIQNFLRQSVDEFSALPDTRSRLASILGEQSG